MLPLQFCVSTILAESSFALSIPSLKTSSSRPEFGFIINLSTRMLFYILCTFITISRHSAKINSFSHSNRPWQLELYSFPRFARELPNRVLSHQSTSPIKCQRLPEIGHASIWRWYLPSAKDVATADARQVTCLTSNWITMTSALSRQGIIPCKGQQLQKFRHCH